MRPLDRYQKHPEDAEPCINCGDPIEDSGTEPWCADCYDDGEADNADSE